MLTASFKVAPAADVKDRAGPQQQSQGSLGVTVKMKGYKKKLLAGESVFLRRFGGHELMRSGGSQDSKLRGGFEQTSCVQLGPLFERC